MTLVPEAELQSMPTNLEAIPPVTGQNFRAACKPCREARTKLTPVRAMGYSFLLIYVILSHRSAKSRVDITKNWSHGPQSVGLTC